MRPADVIGVAIMVAPIVTGEIEGAKESFIWIVLNRGSR
jgi:hypothetical protein